jgi:hypothetical protein
VIERILLFLFAVVAASFIVAPKGLAVSIRSSRGRGNRAGRA